jgi:FtsP/CotA-like multicopper oxidase with cupredoxin domain
MNGKGDAMTHPDQDVQHTLLTRRRLLASAGTGALGLTVAGLLLPRGGVQARSIPAKVTMTLRLAASDTKIRLPGRAIDPGTGQPRELLMFGFAHPPASATTITQITTAMRGKVQVPAPILSIPQGAGLRLDLTNVGLVARPDLSDAHTVHWHGFRNAIALFDGVPEMSISVPPGRTFPYYYQPVDPGTYMYHCHFEDVEHVQMGMTGIVFVTPSTDTATLKSAYNEDVAATRYDRQYALLLNEIDPRPHDNLEAIQEFQWTDYKPVYWVINGRVYPDTVKPENEPSLPRQPVSSLIQANPGQRVLLRIVNLGYEQHAMQLGGIPMTVIGEDATTLVRGSAGPDLSYRTNTVYVGPGESRDVILVAPPFLAGSISGSTPTRGPWNTYLFKNRSYQKLNNNGSVDAATGLGGMVTEVRVYQNPLPAQTRPNQTH